jgi:P27 family predicted phage terminase small subunit
VKGRKPRLRKATKAIGRKKPPAWLSPFAKEEWDRVMPELAARKILTVADLGSLESYCSAMGSVRLFDMLSRKGGIANLDYKALRLRNQSMQIARQLAAELGLTPVSRSRPAVRDNDFDEDDEPLAF